jgi:hypothetical protein
MTLNIWNNEIGTARTILELRRVLHLFLKGNPSENLNILGCKFVICNEGYINKTNCELQCNVC